MAGEQRLIVFGVRRARHQMTERRYRCGCGQRLMQQRSNSGSCIFLQCATTRNSPRPGLAHLMKAKL